MNNVELSYISCYLFFFVFLLNMHHTKMLETKAVDLHLFCGTQVNNFNTCLCTDCYEPSTQCYSTASNSLSSG